MLGLDVTTQTVVGTRGSNGMAEEFVTDVTREWRRKHANGKRRDKVGALLHREGMEVSSASAR